MGRSYWLARRRALAIWVGNGNGTSGRVGVQNWSLSKLLRWEWNLEKFIATGTHNSEPLDHLERWFAAPGVKRAEEEDWGQGRPLNEHCRKVTECACAVTSTRDRLVRHCSVSFLVHIFTGASQHPRPRPCGHWKLGPRFRCCGRNLGNRR